ncbi:uncharacterized protein LOC131857664 [Cryptomeria japonica]|uniref:uncharacterized protein LOC131857664 n=1 Tax=Cryptomeria japonica TaxID=3369 RepID=UPI0027D9FFA8|nr:uncharacterized protein LOC131857664 [Cryptomeria japonica]
MVLIYDHIKANQIAPPQLSLSDSKEEGSYSDFFVGEDSTGDSKSKTEEILEDSKVELGKKRKHESSKLSSSKDKKKRKEKVFQIHSSSSSEVYEDFEKDDSLSPQKKKPKSSFQKRKKQKRQGNSEPKTEDKEKRKDSNADQKVEEEIMGDDFNQSVGGDAITGGEDPKTNQAKASADNMKILISKLENEKGSLEKEPDIEGMEGVQGPRTRTGGKKREKNPNKEIEEVKVASTNYDLLVIKAIELLKSL